MEFSTSSAVTMLGARPFEYVNVKDAPGWGVMTVPVEYHGQVFGSMVNFAVRLTVKVPAGVPVSVQLVYVKLNFSTADGPVPLGGV